MKCVRLLGLLLAVLLAASCGVRPQSVVKREPVSAGAQRTQKTPADAARGTHVVVRGDTLYAIAFRHGLDYRELARFNGISPPYTIYPGQRLNLSAAAPLRGAAPASGGPRGSAPAAGAQASTPASSSPTAATTPAPARGSAVAAPAAPPVVTGTTNRTPPPQSGGSVAWRWPTSGQVIEKFVAGEPTRQGINIAGNAGQPVIAAAAGEVVYSGAGLIGYGELVIIRHSDTFLSAYGHNRKRLVAEGDKVDAGQQIAEMGRSGASRDMLHFEIRRNGKPVDPLPLLPSR